MQIRIDVLGHFLATVTNALITGAGAGLSSKFLANALGEELAGALGGFVGGFVAKRVIKKKGEL